MCLAIPGRIVSINQDRAIVDYNTKKRTAKIVEGNYKVGDYVIVQGGIILQRIPKKDAEEMLKLYAQETNNG